MVLKNSYTCFLSKLGGIEKKCVLTVRLINTAFPPFLHSVIVTSLNFTFTQRFLADFFFPRVYRPIFQVLILFQTKTWRRANFRPTKKYTLSRSCTRSANPLPCQSGVNILFRLFYLVEFDTELSSFRVLKGQTDPRCSYENHTISYHNEQNRYPFQTKTAQNTILFGVAHSLIAYIGE